MKNMVKMATVFLMLLCIIASLYATEYEDQATDDTTKIETLYMNQLKNCQQEKFEKQYEYPFLALLSKEDKKQYNELQNLKQKKEYIEYYWKDHNPNPLLKSNDYLYDFIRRYHYVKNNFSYAKPPYFDHRGKYYLKYGEPSYRYQEKSQIKNADLFRSPLIRSFLREIIGSTTYRRIIIPMQYTVNANETWVYQFLPGGAENELVLHFVAEGKFFREVPSLDNAILSPNTAAIKYFYWADMIKKRASATQSQLVFNTLDQILRFEQDIIDAAWSGASHTTAFDVTSPEHQIRQMKNTLNVKLKRNKSRTPTTRYASSEAIQELSFKYGIAQYKGSQGSTMLIMNYFIPYAFNFSENLESTVSDSISIEYACLFEDHRLERVKQKNYSIRYPLQKISQLKLPYLIESSSISVPAQKGRITLQLKDNATERIGFVKHDISLRDFNTDDLCISDIQFCREIQDSLYRDIYPLIRKRGISVTPYPYESIKRSEQVFCYFEIYNIKSSGIENEYEVAIEVTTVKDKKGLFKRIGNIFSHSQENSISLQQTRIAEQDDSQELIGLDLSNLKPGTYILAIKASDKDKENRSAIITRELEITE